MLPEGQSSVSTTRRITSGDTSFEIAVVQTVGTRELFLEKIPFLILLFGIILTIIGTLYVRNNQMQSRKLSTMNRELAQKNFELNREVDERERLNELVQKTAHRHQNIINAVNDIIFELDHDGNLVFLNQAWRKITGFEIDRVLSRALTQYLYSHDQAAFERGMKDLERGSLRTYRTFTRLRTTDGHFRAIELTMTLGSRNDEHGTQFVGTIDDIEERRRAEKALSEAEQKYRAIVENAPSGLFQITMEGQILNANPAFARILGYGSSDNLMEIIADANSEIYGDAEKRKRALQNIALLKLPKTLETRITKKNGSEIWVHETLRPVFDDYDTLLYFEGSIEDIDQRKNAEIALKEAKTDSDLANRAKSEFLTNMSHELRTPLNAVIGFSDIIRTEAFGPIAQDEYKDYAGNIYDSGNRLLKVINEILDVSRIGAGERTLNESLFSITDTVADCLTFLDGKLKSAQMRVENRLAEKDAVHLIGERQAVKQMLINLLKSFKELF